MCGIIAIHTDPSEHQNKLSKVPSLLSDLIYASGLRGTDSTGVAFINGDGDTRVVKGAFTPLTFLNTKEYKEMNKDASKFQHIIGHTRAATRGLIVDSNAHPFEINNVIGLHNGTLWDYSGLVTRDQSKDYRVDSQYLIHYISDHLNDLPEAMSEVAGDYAVAIWDKKDNKMMYLNNGKRPLYLITVKDVGLSVYCSEHLMGQWVLSRNGFNVNKVYSLQPNHLYTVDENDPSKYTTKKVKEYIPKKSFFSGNQWIGTSIIGLTPVENEVIICRVSKIRNYSNSYCGYDFESSDWPEIIFTYENRSDQPQLDLAVGDRVSALVKWAGKTGYCQIKDVVRVVEDNRKERFVCQSCNSFCREPKKFIEDIILEGETVTNYGPLCSDCHSLLTGNDLYI